MVSRGFFGRKRPQPDRPVPPGQYLENGFPVLTAGPTPRNSLDTWTFKLVGTDGEDLAFWSWSQMQALTQTELVVDIHCVTKWSKQDTTWRGVTINTLLADAGIASPAAYVMAFCQGGYTTNVPTQNLLDDKCMVATEFGGKPLEAAHGGPARLLVPHLYLWKSAKWVRGLKFMDQDQPGFWENAGYHMYGDPWQEQRYWGD